MTHSGNSVFKTYNTGIFSGKDRNELSSQDSVEKGILLKTCLITFIFYYIYLLLYFNLKQDYICSREKEKKKGNICLKFTRAMGLSISWIYSFQWVKNLQKVVSWLWN